MYALDGLTFHLDPPEDLEHWPQHSAHCEGYVTARENTHGIWEVKWRTRPGLDDEARQRFIDWALPALSRLITHGPDIDAWCHGQWGYYLWARPIDLPPDPFEGAS
ncbi:hypothetical protein KC207_14215 [Phycicoccus sp. BSK3Z-2]|uniref:Uncharacterized protein n=1 Tax=Phycicoccus avicenniae TaxID=2828860 RepID=A0A941DAC4_9MICO|nr:hypothetical protein [Phycicoccus avicenniae]MBR7744446.1 hypothetical protein [Phycicoccus avicenniae]